MPLDLDGHGTHVSGTIGQLTNNAERARRHAQRRRDRRRRVQREAHAGEGHRRATGTSSSASPNAGDRRCRRARHPVRGGQRREGHQHEHRPHAVRRPPGRSRTRSSTPSARARSSPIAGRQRLRGRQSRRGARRDRLAGAGRGVGRRRRPQQGPRVLFEHRQLGRARGAGRRLRARSATTGGILQQTLDLDFVETFTLPPPQFTAPRFDVARLLLLHRDVDGHAARRPASRRC